MDENEIIFLKFSRVLVRAPLVPIRRSRRSCCVDFHLLPDPLRQLVVNRFWYMIIAPKLNIRKHEIFQLLLTQLIEHLIYLYTRSDQIIIS